MKSYEEIKEKAKELGLAKHIYESKSFELALLFLSDVPEDEIKACAKEAPLYTKYREFYRKMNEELAQLEEREIKAKKLEEINNNAIDILSSTAKEYKKMIDRLKGKVNEMPDFETAEYRDKYRYEILTKARVELEKENLGVNCASCILRRIKWNLNEED